MQHSQPTPIPQETEMVNIGPIAQRFSVDGILVTMKPGETRHFASAYCLKRKMREGGDPVDGIIPMLTSNQVVPVDSPLAASFKAQREKAQAKH